MYKRQIPYKKMMLMIPMIKHVLKGDSKKEKEFIIALIHNVMASIELLLGTTNTYLEKIASPRKGLTQSWVT